MKALKIAFIFSVSLLIFCCTKKTPPKPNLVLYLVVDQLRGDMLDRYQSRFSESGFKRLMTQGRHFTNAHYSHNSTFTAVGHATLATGLAPSQHGLVGNDWVNTENGEQVYCVEDPSHQLLGIPTPDHAGVSPKMLRTKTLGDRLVESGKRKSRVFGVSLKDRAAILMAGHKGKAFWYSASAGRFVTSSYYYSKEPEWLTHFNKQHSPLKYKQAGWQLLKSKERYLFAKLSQTFSKPVDGMSGGLPYDFSAVPDKKFIKIMRATPMADDLTMEAVLALIDSEKVGQLEGTTDMLAVSLSATDYVGHAFGPYTMEHEDQMLRLDTQISRLLKTVEEKVGKDKFVVVLSADHGVDDTPEHKHFLGVDSGRCEPLEFIKSANNHLKKKYKVKEDLIVRFYNPAMYINRKKVRELKLPLEDVRRVAALHASKGVGIAHAYTFEELKTGQGSGEIFQKVKNGFDPTRSGDVIVVQKPSWFLYKKPNAFSATHGSPYSYDTHVPILLMGPGIESGKVADLVDPRQIAPTLEKLVQLPTDKSLEPALPIKGQSKTL